LWGIKRNWPQKILKTFIASDLISDLSREILGKIGRKGRRKFGGISWVSGVDAMSLDSQVGDDCGAGESEALAGMWARRIPCVG
jgi:hypothetical protein